MSQPPLDPAANPILLGQAAAEATFARARTAGRLPHAWMLQGPRGVGKATLAYRLARSLLDPGRGAGASCHAPGSAIFRMVANRAHPDLRVLARMVDPKSKRLRKEIGIDQVRQANDALRETAAMAPYRVLLVDAADELSLEAANALLKLIEEPPAGVVILLVVQRPGLLPRTIASRCAILRLRPLAPAVLRAALAEAAPELDPGDIDKLMALARGSLGRALELERSGWLLTYDALATALAGGDLGQRLQLIDRLVGHVQASGVEAALDPMRELLRRLAMRLAQDTPLSELVPGEDDTLMRLGQAGGLDRVLALWEKQAALGGRIEAVNLEPAQTLLRIVEAIGERDAIGVG